MSQKAKLMNTRNYALFDNHQWNRPLHEDKALEHSMKTYGFMPSSPIQCIENGDGKLKVIRGHHRLHYAQRLGLDVYYIVDDTCDRIFDLESGKQHWSTVDFCEAYKRAGSPDYATLLEFKAVHHLPIAVAAALVSGSSAGSGAPCQQAKNGTFRVGDMTHASRVVYVTDKLREMGFPFVVYHTFLSAISMCVRVPEFNSDTLIHRIQMNPGDFKKIGTCSDYLDLLETKYIS